jgi:hypothetical protein
MEMNVHDLFRNSAVPNYASIQVLLHTQDDFLKVRETLTRIGVASRKDKTLYQSCHILHKQGRYYIVHFKELFILDGKQADLSENDLQRRNTVAMMLAEWNLVKLCHPERIQGFAPLSQIKVLSFDEKPQWNLQTKYTIGKKR